MLGSATYALSLLKSGAWSRLAADLWHSLTRGYFPKVGFRARVRRWLRRACSCPPLPIWLNRELVARLDLGASGSESRSKNGKNRGLTHGVRRPGDA